MIVIALGIFQQATFYAHTLSHPPPEPRSLSLSLLRQIDYLDIPQDSEVFFFPFYHLETMCFPTTVFHSSFHSHSSLWYLSRLSSSISFSFLSIRHSIVFVISSNSMIPLLLPFYYFSPSFVLDSPGINRLKRLFDSLASLIASFPSLITHSSFFFLPGSRDIASDKLFPRQPVFLPFHSHSASFFPYFSLSWSFLSSSFLFKSFQVFLSISFDSDYVLEHKRFVCLILISFDDWVRMRLMELKRMIENWWRNGWWRVWFVKELFFLSLLSWFLVLIHLNLSFDYSLSLML